MLDLAAADVDTNNVDDPEVYSKCANSSDCGQVDLLLITLWNHSVAGSARVSQRSTVCAGGRTVCGDPRLCGADHHQGPVPLERR